MIKKEYYKTRKDGIKLFKVYSDIGNYIIQIPTWRKCKIAIDVENAYYSYTETDEKIVEETENKN